MPPRGERQFIFQPTPITGSSTMSARAFAAAKESGNVTALANLFAGLTKANYRLELVDVVFYHLQPQWMEHPTPAEYADAQGRMERASALARAANYCTSQGMNGIIGCSPQNLRPQLVQMILSHLDEFSAWIGFLSPVRICSPPAHVTQYADPSGQCATLLYMLDFENAVMAPKLHSSNQIVDFAIGAWVAEDPMTNELCFNLDEDARCPLIHLFSRFVFADDTRERIFDVLYGAALKPKRLRAAVIDAAVTRCKVLANLTRAKVENLPNRRMSGPKLIFKYLELIFGIVHQLSLNKDMRNAILKSAFYEEFMKALRVWLLEKSDRKKDREDRYQAFLLMDMVRSLVEPPDEPYEGSWKCSAAGALRVIRGGFISVLFEGLRSIPARDNEHEGSCWNSLNWLNRTCNQHPCLLEPIQSELKKLLGESFWCTRTFARTGWDRPVRRMAFDVVAGGMFPTRSRHSLCDNIKCNGDRSSSSSRICSGCESMSYCSQECQEMDWKALHHDECKPAGLYFHRLLNTNQLHYRPSLRQHQAQLSAHRAMMELRETPSLRDELDIGPSVLMLDGVPAAYGVKEYGEIRGVALTNRKGVQVSRNHDESGKYPPKFDHYLDRRIRALTRGYISNGWKRGQRLVEATHYLGYRHVSVLVLVESLDPVKSTRQSGSAGSPEAGNDGGSEGDQVGKGRVGCKVLFCITEMISDSLGDSEASSESDEWVDTDS